MNNNLYSQHFKNIPEASIIEDFKQSCKEAAAKLRAQIQSSELAAIDVVFDQGNLKSLNDFAQKASSYKKILILGVGGSSLGGKTLTALKSDHKIEFLESIDPLTIQNSLRNIDFSETFFLVISKSGETIETICQTLIILQQFEHLGIQDFSQQFLFITESEENSLAKIAKKIGAEITAHSNKIGGRYSCFSIVGMLPALIAGLNAEKVRNGAKKILKDFLEDDDISNSCAMQLALYEKGYVNNVIMPYIDELKNFTDWYRQLWAESLGKDGFGSIPINSMGTIDQHSQLQLYLDGPKDKFFTFITQENTKCDFAIKDLAGCKTLFGGKNLSQIVKVEQGTTIEILNQKNLPIRIFKIEDLNEEVLGGLMMQMFLETILIAYAKNIDPFDQPAVELRKKSAKEILGENH